MRLDFSDLTFNVGIACSFYYNVGPLALQWILHDIQAWIIHEIHEIFDRWIILCLYISSSSLFSGSVFSSSLFSGFVFSGFIFSSFLFSGSFFWAFLFSGYLFFSPCFLTLLKLCVPKCNRWFLWYDKYKWYT